MGRIRSRGSLSRDSSSHIVIYTEPPLALTSGQTMSYSGVASDVNGVNEVHVNIYAWNYTTSTPMYWKDTTAEWIPTYWHVPLPLDTPDQVFTGFSGDITAPLTNPPVGFTGPYINVVVKDVLNNYQVVYQQFNHTVTIDNSSQINVTGKPPTNISLNQSVTYSGTANDPQGVALVQLMYIYWDGTQDNYYNWVTTTWTPTYSADTVRVATLGSSGATSTTWTVTTTSPATLPPAGTECYVKFLVGDSVPNYEVPNDGLVIHNLVSNVQYRSSSISTMGAVSSVNNPAGSVAGDIVFITIGQFNNPSPADVTIPGFTVLNRSANFTGFFSTITRLQTFYRVLDGSEGSTFPITGAGFCQVGAICFQNPHGAPINAFATTTSSSNPAVLTGVTPTVSNSIIVVFSASNYGENPALSGFTQAQSNGISIYYKAGPVSGVATGNINAANPGQVAVAATVVALY